MILDSGLLFGLPCTSVRSVIDIHNYLVGYNLAPTKANKVSKWTDKYMDRTAQYTSEANYIISDILPEL